MLIAGVSGLTPGIETLKQNGNLAGSNLLIMALSEAGCGAARFVLPVLVFAGVIPAAVLPVGSVIGVRIRRDWVLSLDNLRHARTRNLRPTIRESVRSQVSWQAAAFSKLRLLRPARNYDSLRQRYVDEIDEADRVLVVALSARHVLVNCRHCNGNISDSQAVRDVLAEATGTLGVRVVEQRVHSFRPQAVTALAIVAKSHFSMHTWPECRYLAADFTCGKSAVDECRSGRMPQWTNAAVDECRSGSAATIFQTGAHQGQGD